MRCLRKIRITCRSSKISRYKPVAVAEYQDIQPPPSVKMKDSKMIPSFLLAKLYVKDSLKNTASGFEFMLKNNLDSTMLIGIGPIGLGDKTYVGESVNITVGDKTINAAELSRQTSVPVRVGTLIKVSVAGEKLTPGLQKVNVTATSSDIGQIKFDINDALS